MYSRFKDEWGEAVPHFSFLKCTWLKWHTAIHGHMEETRLNNKPIEMLERDEYSMEIHLLCSGMH
jgi:hypothetical protein